LKLDYYNNSFDVAVSGIQVCGFGSNRAFVKDQNNAMIIIN